MNEWISFADKQPNDGQRCIATILMPNGVLREEILRWSNNEWYYSEHHKITTAIIAWIPLPEPYKC